MPLNQLTIDKLAEAATDLSMPMSTLKLFEALAEELAAVKARVATKTDEVIVAINTQGAAIVAAIEAP